MKSKPKTIDEYLAPLSPDKRAALVKLRKVIKAAVPDAEECVSYGLAAFRLNGRPLVAFGASESHCAFYPMSGNTVQALKVELRNFETSKGTIRFQPGKPLPASLVRKLIKARVAENDHKSARQRTSAKKRRAQPNRRRAPRRAGRAGPTRPDRGRLHAA